MNRKIVHIRSYRRSQSHLSPTLWLMAMRSKNITLCRQHDYNKWRVRCTDFPRVQTVFTRWASRQCTRKDRLLLIKRFLFSSLVRYDRFSHARIVDGNGRNKTLTNHWNRRLYLDALGSMYFLRPHTRDLCASHLPTHGYSCTRIQIYTTSVFFSNRTYLQTNRSVHAAVSQTDSCSVSWSQFEIYRTYLFAYKRWSVWMFQSSKIVLTFLNYFFFWH